MFEESCPRARASRNQSAIGSIRNVFQKMWFRDTCWMPQRALPLRGVHFVDNTALWRVHVNSNLVSFDDCCMFVGLGCSGSRFVRQVLHGVGLGCSGRRFVRDMPSMWHWLFMHRTFSLETSFPQARPSRNQSAINSRRKKSFRKDGFGTQCGRLDGKGTNYVPVWEGI